jgi:hypothetical protein
MASTVSGDNGLLKGSNTHLPLLKADSEATMEIRMTNTSRAISARVGYFGALTFHQVKISKSMIFASYPSNKYNPPPTYIPSHSLPLGIERISS